MVKGIQVYDGDGIDHKPAVASFFSFEWQCCHEVAQEIVIGLKVLYKGQERTTVDIDREAIHRGARMQMEITRSSFPNAIKLEILEHCKILNFIPVDLNYAFQKSLNRFLDEWPL